MSSHKPRYINRYTFLLLLTFVIATVLLLGTSSSSDNSDLQASASAYTSGSGGGGRRVITTEDVVSGRYYARGVNSSWVEHQDDLSWVSGSSGDLVRFGVGTGVGVNGSGRFRKDIVVKAEQFISRPWKVKFSGGNDGFVLVGFEPKRLFRSTILARYAVHSAKTGQLLQQLSTTPKPPTEEGPPPQFQLAQWSNDNVTILAVHNNDVYALRLGGGGGKVKTVRLSWDGSETIFNGVADWVYEEELFTSSPSAVFPSKTGTYVAYLKFNDSSVQPSNYNLYGDYASEPFFDEYFQYPKFGTVRYPKSGTTNPTVSVHVVRLGEDRKRDRRGDGGGGGLSCWDEFSRGGVVHSDCSWGFDLDEMMGGLVRGEDEYLIGSFKWVGGEIFVMNVLNRVQNSSWLVECDVGERGCVVVKADTQVNGWIDNGAIFHFKSEYFRILSVGSPLDGLEYGSVVSVSKNGVSRVITVGRYTVDEIVGIYTYQVGGISRDLLIFKSSLIGDKGDGMVTIDPSQSHYYAVDLNKSTDPVCLSCYSDCAYNTGKFSSSGEYFVNNCEGGGRVSRVEVVGILVGVESVRSIVKVKLEGNHLLEKKLAGLELPEVEYFSIPYSVGGGGGGLVRNYSLSCKVVGPVGWKSGGYAQYPVVVDIYGGPNSQKVTKKFTPNDWSYSLASNSITPTVYLTIDGIGSGRQSNSMAFEVYRNLGDKEILDKIYAVKWFLKEYSSLDPARTLVWGWSYGGYVSGMVMGRDKESVLKCGISVAPVVNWFYYDTIYTERYMSTPSDNEMGYNSSNILHYLDNFRGKDYLLVHGNADDNVHYQQSMVLARGLEQRAILFRMQSYPDENHSLGSVRPHLFATLEDFVFNQCFRSRGTKK